VSCSSRASRGLERGLTAAAVAGVFAGFGACAGQSADASTRLAALEARVTRLEQSQHAADASAPETTNSELPPPSAGYAIRLDAGQGWGTMGIDASGGTVVTPAEQHVTSPAEHCKRWARETCAHAARNAAARVQQPADGGFTWVKPAPTIAPESNAAGRACLKREMKRCNEMALSEQRTARLFEWLDAQLSPDRIDAEHSRQLRERLLRQGLPVAATDDVLCTAEFCKISATDAGVGRPLSFGEASEIMYGNGAAYVTRQGYRFPHR